MNPDSSGDSYRNGPIFSRHARYQAELAAQRRGVYDDHMYEQEQQQKRREEWAKLAMVMSYQRWTHLKRYLAISNWKGNLQLPPIAINEDFDNAFMLDEPSIKELKSFQNQFKYEAWNNRWLYKMKFVDMEKANPEEYKKGLQNEKTEFYKRFQTHLKTLDDNLLGRYRYNGDAHYLIDGDSTMLSIVQEEIKRRRAPFQLTDANITSFMEDVGGAFIKRVKQFVIEIKSSINHPDEDDISDIYSEIVERIKSGFHEENTIVYRDTPDGGGQQLQIDITVTFLETETILKPETLISTTKGRLKKFIENDVDQILVSGSVYILKDQTKKDLIWMGTSSTLKKSPDEKQNEYRYAQQLMTALSKQVAEQLHSKYIVAMNGIQHIWEEYKHNELNRDRNEAQLLLKGGGIHESPIRFYLVRRSVK